MKSLHLKISQDTHNKFCEIAGDRKLGSVQVEIFTDAVNELHAKLFTTEGIMETLASTKHE